MALYRITDAGEVNPAYDVRGWEVHTEADEKRVGKVDDVLCDAAGRPRYLDVDLGTFKKRVLLPIGHARADAREELVWVKGMSEDAFEGIPDFDHDPARASRDYETRVHRAYDSALVGDTEPRASRAAGLAPIGELKGIRVVADDADPRGWAVVSAEGRRIGEVEELIVDTRMMKVRYLDVDLDVKGLDLGRADRHILLPVAQARLDRDDECVIVDGLEATGLPDYPVYGGMPIAQDFDEQVRSRFTHQGRRDNFYDDPAYDSDDFLGSRAGAAGAWAGEAVPPSDAVGSERGGEQRVSMSDDDQLRIRVRGDEVIVEKRARE